MLVGIDSRDGLTRRTSGPFHVADIVFGYPFSSSSHILFLSLAPSLPKIETPPLLFPSFHTYRSISPLFLFLFFVSVFCFSVFFFLRLPFSLFSIFFAFVFLLVEAWPCRFTSKSDSNRCSQLQNTQHPFNPSPAVYLVWLLVRKGYNKRRWTGNYSNVQGITQRVIGVRRIWEIHERIRTCSPTFLWDREGRGV